RLLKPGDDKPLYFGCRPTVLANEAEVRQAFLNDELFQASIEVVDTPQQALARTADMVEAVFQQVE
ncbi:MAG: hypothetical protein NZL85_02930, partial [Fimbriimonadales bacterium]|nr:hypothetical protein [Fimbriimonadales bacterium]